VACPHTAPLHRGSAPKDVGGSGSEGCKQSVKLSSEAINVFLMCELRRKQSRRKKIKSLPNMDGTSPTTQTFGNVSSRGWEKRDPP